MAAAQTPDYIMRVSSQKGPGAYINPAKRILQAHGFVELHGAGVATGTAIIAAERIMTYGYATLEKLETSKVEGSNTAKVEVRLNKGPGFDEAEQKFLKQNAS